MSLSAIHGQPALLFLPPLYTYLYLVTNYGLAFKCHLHIAEQPPILSSPLVGALPYIPIPADEAIAKTQS